MKKIYKTKKGLSPHNQALLKQYLLKKFLLFFLIMVSYSAFAKSPVEENGKLSISGNFLINENGIPVQLRGMSTHGLQWFTQGYNFNSLSELANNWGIDVFRVAMYPSTLLEDHTLSSYDGNPDYWNSYIDHLVDICGQLGIYCIIDWHVLTPGDPNDPSTLPLAKKFWDYMSKKHAGKKHVLYEICNEPNGATTWLNVKTYANTIIPIIRANDPNTVIIVGSPNWSQDVDIAANDPILDPTTGLLAPNVMYSLHFYADTHKDKYRNKADTALSKGLAIFATEWGSMGASGKGTSNWESTDQWLSFMQARKISWCNWQYSDNGDSKVLQPCSGFTSLWGNTNEQGDSLKKFIANPSDSWDDYGMWKPAIDIAYPTGIEYFTPGQIIFLKANAAQGYANINNVDFYVDNNKIGTASSPDFTLQWKPSAAKDYTITAVALGIYGTKSSVSSPVTCHVVSSLPAQKAYPSGIPSPIPGKINLINFDYGGEGVAYHDVDAVHKGPVNNDRQSEGVDVEGQINIPTPDIGYVLAGEWLEYTVNVATSGIYDFSLPYATGYPCNGQVHLESNGAPITDKLFLASTGDWGKYDTLKTKVALKAGQQVLRLSFDIGGFNFRSMIFANPSGNIHTITASADNGGIINPATNIVVKDGDNYTLTFVAPAGYKLSDVVVGTGSVFSAVQNSSYTLTNITADKTVQAKFTSLPVFTITASTPTGGAITPAGSTTIYQGGNVSYSITPSQGRKLVSLVIDNTDFIALPSYTFSNVTGTHSIGAKFGAVITATAGPGGIITPGDSVVAVLGQDATFTITPSDGFQVSNVIVDNQSYGSLTSYTIPSVSGDHTIKATFSLLPGYHSISVNSNSWGTVSPSGTVAVANGASQTFTFAPYANADMTVLIIDNLGIGPQTEHTFNDVTDDHTIDILFEPYYIISASAGPGGSISSQGDSKYYNGTSRAYCFTPDPGYAIYDVKVDSISQGAIGCYNFTDITENHIITVTFVRVNTMTVTQSDGGTIEPGGTFNVIKNSTTKLNAVSWPGYLLTGYTVNGKFYPQSDTSYVIQVYNDQDIMVSAEFTPISSMIPVYVNTNAGGSVGADDVDFVAPGVIYIAYGRNVVLGIHRNTNFNITDVTVNGVSWGTDNNYIELKNITEVQTVDVTFSPMDNYHIIVSSATTGGTINPLGGYAIQDGGSTNYVITALPGYRISDVVINDNQHMGAVNTYLFTQVTSDQKIQVIFTPAPSYTISTTTTYGGTINPSGNNEVAAGSQLTIFSTPWENYSLKDLTDNGQSKGMESQYLLDDIETNHVINATFAIQHIISAYAGTGGTITPPDKTLVFDGSNLTYTITPSAGYVINDVTVDGVSQGAITSYPFNNIVEEHSICATFRNPTCLLTSYAVPSSKALPSVNTTYTFAYILGTHDPIANFKDFYIQWDLQNKGLYNFSMHPTTGYVDFKNYIGSSQTFASASPGVKITGSNTGMDGDYYVVMDGSNFVMIDKAGAYAVYFSNSSTPPTNNCNSGSTPPNYFKITAPAYSLGTVDPSNIAVSQGDNMVITITPAANYKITDVKIDGVSKGVISSYTFSDVKSNHTVTAEFANLCDLLALYKAPRKTALPSVLFTKYPYIYVIGNHAPITKMKDFTLQWDLANKGLSDFSTNLNVAPWYLDLKTKMTQNFASASPGCIISNSGIGLDGNYYAVMDGNNFALVEKTGAYVVYFSNSSTPPSSCSVIKTEEIAPDTETPESALSLVYPNPVDGKGFFAIDLTPISDKGAEITIFDINKKVVYTNVTKDAHTNISLNGKFSSGFYIVRIINGTKQSYSKLIVR